MLDGTKHLIDNAREFAESGDRYTGPEVRVWVYELCDEIERLCASRDAALVHFEKIALETQDQAQCGKAFWARAAAEALRQHMGIP